MIPPTVSMRSWSSLPEVERDALLAAYQPVLACHDNTCSFATKLERMQAWLAGHGVTISEDEIRGRRPAEDAIKSTDNNQPDEGT